MKESHLGLLDIPGVTKSMLAIGISSARSDETPLYEDRRFKKDGFVGKKRLGGTIYFVKI